MRVAEGELDLGDAGAGGASTLRSSACAQTAPNIRLAPITATGLLPAGSASGREAQSTAFLSTPGIDELYSGVANSRASASAIARSRPTTGAGPFPYVVVLVIGRDRLEPVEELELVLWISGAALLAVFSVLTYDMQLTKVFSPIYIGGRPPAG